MDIREIFIASPPHRRSTTSLNIQFHQDLCPARVLATLPKNDIPAVLDHVIRPAHRLSDSLTDFVELPLLFKAFQGVLTGVVEFNFGARDEILHGS
jgi:hypothetical protein